MARPSRTATVQFPVSGELLLRRHRGESSSSFQGGGPSGGGDDYAAGINAWQNEFQVKIALIASSITKRTSQTEVMMHIFKLGDKGSLTDDAALEHGTASEDST